MPNTVHFPHSPGKRYQWRLTALATVKTHFEQFPSVFGYLWSCERAACPPKELWPSRTFPASNLVVTRVGGTGPTGYWELQELCPAQPSVCTQNNPAEQNNNRAERWKRVLKSRLSALGVRQG